MDGDRVLAASSYLELRAHAERLFAAIDEACRAAGISKHDIDAIACDVGPGSFTGVRVAVAAAHGIALALGRPTASVTSLEAMAAAAGDGASVVAALDAFKEELYLGSFGIEGGIARPAGPAHASSRDAARAFLAEQRAAGRLLLGSVLDGLGIEPSIRSDATDLPDAAWIARVAQRRGIQPGASPTLEPVYVRPPDAKPLAAALPANGTEPT